MQVELAKRQIQEGKFSQQSLYSLAFPDDTFDGFWSSAVFLHLPKRKLPVALSEVRRVTKHGGMGFISVKQGEGEKMEGERFWALYRQEEFKERLLESGFGIKAEYKKVSSPTTTWLVYFVEV